MGATAIAHLHFPIRAPDQARHLHNFDTNGHFATVLYGYVIWPRT